ncbi:hypothetical protein KKH82_00225 [Patescibacteria group bacterium]|nr:hypothetical protein [Patescibacteria group bacterium]
MSSNHWKVVLLLSMAQKSSPCTFNGSLAITMCLVRFDDICSCKGSNAGVALQKLRPLALFMIDSLIAISLLSLTRVPLLYSTAILGNILKYIAFFSHSRDRSTMISSHSPSSLASQLSHNHSSNHENTLGGSLMFQVNDHQLKYVFVDDQV